MKGRFVFLINLLCSVIICGRALGQVYISGPLSGVLEDTTYIVEGDISVEAGDSLIIMPGAVFLFNSSWNFDINGYIYAVGTTSDSIKFMLNVGAPMWDGIDFNESSSDSSLLEYCYITGSHSSGIRCDYCSPTIRNSTIYDNWSFLHGGGIYCYYSDVTIDNCIITENSCWDYGGGICMKYSNPIITNCKISDNFGEYPGGEGIGGGIWCYFSSNPTIKNCIIHGNRSRSSGSGIYGSSDSHLTIVNCTICLNEITWYGGSGVLCTNPLTTMVNSIVWRNSPEQIIGNFGVTYSNIQDGWPGLGNIDSDPLFAIPEQNDYRLQWGSPCIDTGNPDPSYNDPDGTVADMGACYFDQSHPVRALLTPYNIPISIPPEGGDFDYAIQATNIDSVEHTTIIWCDVTLPDGIVYGPILGPTSVTLEPDQTISRIRSQAVPAGAPGGLYFYNAYAVVDADTSTDSFYFFKQELGGNGINTGWSNQGEIFGVYVQIESHQSDLKSDQDLVDLFCSPNPFNSTTVISFALAEASNVILNIYDVQGRNVSTVIDRFMSAGTHEVCFNAPTLSTGIYFAHLEAGAFRTIQKLVLLR